MFCKRVNGKFSFIYKTPEVKENEKPRAKDY